MPQNSITEVQTPTAWFSKSKTRAPKFSVSLVERVNLLADLDSALNKPISCVVAPAGFGKSTLLSQWRETLIARDIRCAWINLDENDKEIRQFFAYLVFAFEDAGVSLGYLKKAAENGFVDMSSAAITTSLLSAIIDIDDHIVLILDDYHRPGSKEIDEFIQFLSDQCGDKVHIAIGSRTSVSIGLPTLLASGQAIEIPSGKLRFSNQEVKEAMEGEFDQDAIDAIQAQVEGWPVAVQMTRLLGQSAKASVEPKIASHGHLADYLVTNVLESQPEELQDFLLETSILESFNVELADAVCGHNESRSLFRQLEPLQALIVPLDDDLEWFRYHHLFADCLSDLLKRKDTNRFTELHRRAAKWCGENRMIAEAVNYANAIKDYDLSKQIINNNCEWIRAEQFGGVGYLNGLLSNIPEQEIAKDPRMLFSKANACMIVGDFKKSLFYNNAAEALIKQNGISPETLRDRFEVGTGIEIRVETGVDRSGGWLKERLDIVDALAESEPAVKIVCGLMRTALTVQKLGYGDFDVAREYAVAAESNLSKANNPITVSYCQVSIGLLDLWTNALDDARNHFQTAVDLAVSFTGDLSNMKFVGETLLKSVEYWQSELTTNPPEELEYALMHALETDGWYDVYSIGFDTVVHDALIRKEYERAEILVGKLEQATDRLAIERLTQFAQLLRLDCASVCMDLSEAASIFERVTAWLDVDEKKFDDLGWYHRTSAFYSSARYLGAIDNYDAALSYVEQGLEEVDQLDVVLMRVRGNILKASILEQAGRGDEALVVLEYAIVDAARVSCVKAFTHDVSEALLAKAVLSTMEKEQIHIVKEFATKLAVAGAQTMFSSREEEVLQGIAQGKSNKEIARDLDLTDNTIKFHLRNIYQKLGVKKRVPAVEKARELGIIS